ncbi:hypothetical protein FH972_023058 [Carpinus fangiana]|uniref:alkaline phosphatase n=1 Tax=Carpinus fangiana TaxID=176857 RepID=A0A5N6KU22_9ROSI|nr:hypothetical protein FH972_023058 [Carpinus fangiana]
MSPSKFALVASLLLASSPIAYGQTFQRLGTCPTFGCVFPPDQADFLAGAYFDVRLEVHAPVNGSEATGNPNPNPNFTFTIAKDGQRGRPTNAATLFGVREPAVETWQFGWYEDLFAQDAKTKSLVNVAGKAYRRVSLNEPGTYTATLTYNNGQKTEARWFVRDIPSRRRAKNVLLFIGDGMTTNMITAARLIAHKSVNGKYQTKMALDSFPILGHQMTHSVDSYITDSANSATALYTGHKSTVNALGVYADSSPDPFDDPKVETIAELFQRYTGGGVGIVSTAFIADATPAAMTAHTRLRALYGQVVNSFLYGQTNWTWTDWKGPDVLFGGGAEQFYPNKNSFQGQDYYKLFAQEGYQVVNNATSLASIDTAKRALGIFSVSNMAKWLDRNVYPANLRGKKSAPNGDGGDALDQPGLKEMTLKGLEVLTKRHRKNGWLMMSEAASIDKMMHVLDYERALGELLELDDTVKAAMQYLEKTGQADDTLVIVTADHGHGFDVAGSVDTKYFDAQSGDRKKRGAVGIYQESGLSQYTVADPSRGADANLVYSSGANFPANWDPRYTLSQGVMQFPDHKEDYRVKKGGPRVPAVNITGFPSGEYFASYVDAPTGILINGTLPVSADQGVHSLTDVPVFSKGPCQELFGGVYGNIDVFYGMAQCLGLSRPGKNGARPPNHGGPPSY